MSPSESIRELITVPPDIERTLQLYLRRHPEDARGIEKVLSFRRRVRAELTAWCANGSRQRSKYQSVSSGNRHADDAGEHLVQGFRIAALIEEEHQFENLHIHAFERVRAWSWSVPY